MPVDLNKLNEGWLELESDPGLFTLLLEDFGAKGVQVEEIYDLQKPLVEGPVYGFIFLFKWIEERRSRRKIVVADETFVDNEDIVNSMFFAQQMIPNSCATHALLSVLLNCDKIHLGETLSKLKQFTKNMSPENKGYAIGNAPELAKAHNSHAKPEPRHLPEKSHGISTGRTMEAFHFVSYVPINGRLFELDGLKPSPIDHGPWKEVEDWTEKFRRVITERLGIATGGEPYHDIRFNLMAVVADRRQAYEHKLNTLKTNRQIVLEALQHLVQMTHPDLTSQDKAQYMAAVRKNRTKQEVPPPPPPPPSSKEPESQPIQNGPSSSGTPPGRTRLRHRTSAYFHKLPAALDTHNYAKSPLMEGQEEEDEDLDDYSHSDIDSESEYLSADDCLPSTDEPEKSKVLVENGVNSNSSSNLSISDSRSNKKFDCNKKPTISAASVSAELTKPLTIQTKFEVSPAPSSESTDTSSEVGSAFNSPVLSANQSLQNSPNSARINKFSSDDSASVNTKDIKKFVVIKVSGRHAEHQEVVPEKKVPHSMTESNEVEIIAIENKINGKRPASENVENEPSAKKIAESDNPLDCKSEDNSERTLAKKSENENPVTTIKENKSNGNSNKPDTKSPNSKYPHLSGHHAFAPKDLLALLKNVENEISICENNLREEYEKRRKYKVDDCRRTHNYDQFICTFLSMLAEQGHLADLVEQHMLIRRRQGVTLGRLNKTRKPDRRRRSRPKKKK